MERIRIETYKPRYRNDFVRLNREWIERYFSIEPSDIRTFENIDNYILGKGGQIFLAVLTNDENKEDHEEVIGCCALIPHPDRDSHELAKMAVSPRHQGHGTGLLLGNALVCYARQHGAKRLFLEGNTKLKASIALYKKLGFTEEAVDPPTYDRCNIIMGMDLTH